MRGNINNIYQISIKAYLRRDQKQKEGCSLTAASQSPCKHICYCICVFDNNCILYLFHLKLFVIEPIQLHCSCTLNIFIADMIFIEYRRWPSMICFLKSWKCEIFLQVVAMQCLWSQPEVEVKQIESENSLQRQFYSAQLQFKSNYI